MKYVIALLLLTGCTADGSVEDLGHDLICLDSRDGERFKLITKTIKNVRYGIGAPSCYEVQDGDGRWRTICSGIEQYVKCQPTPRETAEAKRKVESLSYQGEQA